MTYSVNFLAHIQAIKECLPRFEGRASCNIETGVLQVRARGRSVEFLPQFAVRNGDSTGFSPTIQPDTEFFVGWRPYGHRAWPLAFDKRTFKEFCAQKGLPTPRSWPQAQAVAGNVLVKNATASFSRGISGPFTPEAVKTRNRRLQQGEFFEEFTQGDIVKAWYWNETPVVLDVRPMPSVTGDGSRTLRTLIQRRRSALLPKSDWEVWAEVAAFQGMTLDTVVPGGQTVLVDFRYPSPLHPALPDNPNLNVLSAYEGKPLLRQLRDAGKIFFDAIPEQLRQNILFSVDAIAAARQEVIYLEMNCNPLAHPDCYAPMFESLFGTPAMLQSPPATPRLKIAAAG